MYNSFQPPPQVKVRQEHASHKNHEVRRDRENYCTQNNTFFNNTRPQFSPINPNLVGTYMKKHRTGEEHSPYRILEGEYGSIYQGMTRHVPFTQLFHYAQRGASHNNNLNSEGAGNEFYQHGIGRSSFGPNEVDHTSYTDGLNNTDIHRVEPYRLNTGIGANCHMECASQVLRHHNGYPPFGHVDFNNHNICDRAETCITSGGDTHVIHHYDGTNPTAHREEAYGMVPGTEDATASVFNHRNADTFATTNCDRNLDNVFHHHKESRDASSGRRGGHHSSHGLQGSQYYYFKPNDDHGGGIGAEDFVFHNHLDSNDDSGSSQGENWGTGCSDYIIHHHGGSHDEMKPHNRHHREPNYRRKDEYFFTPTEAEGIGSGEFFVHHH